MTTDDELRRLGLQLIQLCHLNVPERRSLPPTGMPFSVLVATVTERLEATGWFPRPPIPGRDIGDLPDIELRGTEVWVHEQDSEIRVDEELKIAQRWFGAVRSRRVNTVTDAVRMYVEAIGGDSIDGVPVDWST